MDHRAASDRRDAAAKRSMARSETEKPGAVSRLGAIPQFEFHE
jgi:hypothetical protein